MGSLQGDLLDPTHLLALLPLRPYQVVADIGCGAGFFTIALAKYLFDGRVYAVDPDQEMLDALERKLREIRLNNVKLVRSIKDGLGLQEDSLDGVLLPFVLHGVPDTKALMSQVLSSLRRAGWMAVLEWHKQQPEESPVGGPPVEQRLLLQEVEELARAAGFRSLEHRDLTTRQYMVLARK